jgi:hypothetical protein
MTAYHLLSVRIGLGTPAAVATTPLGARFFTPRLGLDADGVGRGSAGAGLASAPAEIPPLPPPGSPRFLHPSPNNATFSRFKLIWVSCNASVS